MKSPLDEVPVQIFQRASGYKIPFFRVDHNIVLLALQIIDLGDIEMYPPAVNAENNGIPGLLFPYGIHCLGYKL